MRQVRRRRELIVALVASKSIGTQEDLVEVLRQQGVEASQASVSRDITALGLVKVGGRYVLQAPARRVQNPNQERVAELLLAVTQVGDHLLVLKTLPGEAPALALAIDRLGFPGVVGTVAGDDTIMAAVENTRAGRNTVRHLRALIAGSPTEFVEEGPEE